MTERKKDDVMMILQGMMNETLPSDKVEEESEPRRPTRRDALQPANYGHFSGSADGATRETNRNEGCSIGSDALVLISNLSEHSENSVCNVVASMLQNNSFEKQENPPSTAPLVCISSFHSSEDRFRADLVNTWKSYPAETRPPSIPIRQPSKFEPMEVEPLPRGRDEFFIQRSLDSVDSLQIFENEHDGSCDNEGTSTRSQPTSSKHLAPRLPRRIPSAA